MKRQMKICEKCRHLLKDGECNNRDMGSFAVFDLQDEMDAKFIFNLSIIAGTNDITYKQIRTEIKDMRKAEMPEECSMFLEQIVME